MRRFSIVWGLAPQSLHRSKVNSLCWERGHVGGLGDLFLHGLGCQGQTSLVQSLQ